MQRTETDFGVLFLPRGVYEVKNIYRPIRQHKVTEEIVAQIKSLLKEGTLQPGEKLPSERMLCGLLGVGRSSLREALNILEALGFLEIKNRRGIFVHSVSSPLLYDPLVQILREGKAGLGDLYGIRKDIELGSAYLAAKLRSKKDLVRLKEFLGRMETAAQNGSRWSIRDDMDYHLAVAQASGNPLRLHILKNIFDLAGEFFRISAEKITAIWLANVFEQHRKVFRAIECGDQEGARVQMEEHLSWGEEKWRALSAEINPQQ
jgi:GntR family transcriptional regulator, transcriptional repressor for pyruvate dehydrogenase complex